MLQKARISLFLWLDNIHMYTHICINFFIYSSINGPLSCFCILAIINNNAMNTGVHIYFQIDVSVFLR